MHEWFTARGCEGQAKERRKTHHFGLVHVPEDGMAVEPVEVLCGLSPLHPRHVREAHLGVHKGPPVHDPLALDDDIVVVVTQLQDFLRRRAAVSNL